MGEFRFVRLVGCCLLLALSSVSSSDIRESEVEFADNTSGEKSTATDYTTTEIATTTTYASNYLVSSSSSWQSSSTSTTGAPYPSSSESFSTEVSNSQITYDASEVALKSPIEILKLRGFKAENHYARTKDGYYINVVRIVNPHVNRDFLKRPVIFNHGFLESSTIWLIQSRGVQASRFRGSCEAKRRNVTTEERVSYVNGPMMLANYGYDVWLMSMRGTDYSMRHERLSPRDSQFWDYSLDDFGLVDVPTVVEYIRRETGQPKVAYVGHSQATFSVFALLASRPKFAKVIEPVIAVAPVAYFDHITSVARPIFLGALSTTKDSTNAPFPRRASKIRKTADKTCAGDLTGKASFICSVIEVLVSGSGRKWPAGFYSHLPYHSSLKVVRHFGQLIKKKRFGMYDYGPEINQKLYGRRQSPAYPIENIRSRSLVLISTRSDALSVPADVDHFKRQLTVPVYRDIFIDKQFNHFDLITDPEASELVFKPILEVIETFERKSNSCSKPKGPYEPVGSDFDVKFADKGL